MEDAPHPEIIIIRRRGGHGEAEHHGGAWKIAFADFMTAMMAFFLVLWIIAATDKDTKTIIARYFNPVKLEELSRTPKSIHGDGSATPAVDAPDDKPRRRNRSQPGRRSAPPRRRTTRRRRRRRPASTSRTRNSPGAAANLGDPASPEGEHERGRAVRRSLPQSRRHRRTDLAQRARDHAARRDERRAGRATASPIRSARRRAASPRPSPSETADAAEADRAGGRKPRADRRAAGRPRRRRRPRATRRSRRPPPTREAKPSAGRRRSPAERAGAADRAAGRGAAGPGRRRQGDRRRPADQPHRQTEFHDVRDRLGRTAAAVDPGDGRHRRHPQAAARRGRRARPHRRASLQVARPTTTGGCRRRARRWPITCSRAPDCRRAVSSESRATPTNGCAIPLIRSPPRTAASKSCSREPSRERAAPRLRAGGHGDCRRRARRRRRVGADDLRSDLGPAEPAGAHRRRRQSGLRQPGRTDQRRRRRDRRRQARGLAIEARDRFGRHLSLERRPAARHRPPGGKRRCSGQRNPAHAGGPRLRARQRAGGREAPVGDRRASDFLCGSPARWPSPNRCSRPAAIRPRRSNCSISRACSLRERWSKRRRCGARSCWSADQHDVDRVARVGAPIRLALRRARSTPRASCRPWPARSLNPARSTVPPTFAKFAAFFAALAPETRRRFLLRCRARGDADGRFEVAAAAARKRCASSSPTASTRRAASSMKRWRAF